MLRPARDNLWGLSVNIYHAFKELTEKRNGAVMEVLRIDQHAESEDAEAKASERD